MFVVILTVFAALGSSSSPSATTVTLNQEAQIVFTDTTEKKAMAACVRVQKALNAAGHTSMCTDKAQ